MRYSLLFSIVLVAIVSCNKNKFNTIPSLKYESASTQVVHAGDLLSFKLNFTDAEGDFNNDSTLFVQEKALNCATSGFKQFYPFPTFTTTKNQEGEILVTFVYRGSSSITPLPDPKCFKNDTSIFRFALRDKARHTSDTVVSEKIVIIY